MASSSAPATAAAAPPPADAPIDALLFVARECFVYKVPPRASLAGYKAAEWGDMEAFLWKGRLRIVEHGAACSIRLEDGDSGELFARAPYDADGTAVEPVLDSSRYFVLRVQGEDGRRAFVGMGFLDRSDAFDFNVALQDWTKCVCSSHASLSPADDRPPRRARAAASPAAAEEAGPSPHAPPQGTDYSLKAGQTFAVKLPGAAARRKDKPAATAGAPAFGAGGGLLPPPPPGRRA
ncbi:adaptin ear-binding coat-associated protein 1 NECAP-1 [Tilletiopsis washingtonensis]|uniref:Adaptin ear-binding coat-associated protein 1 NECAP-1 n=1 Tax=Tilletiopsis washingtonensis TaxID=58919 RepID=A0A316Z402_9BASI|nr:adaptin ear-binding coat-associated protein 1 NECAP-1 [Tilletiopsis washingtonensis]PWN96291.1 adaptin ear-binding coat-associated protein 1 NECAP-1 [Tilletiopsis washingtonensis]